MGEVDIPEHREWTPLNGKAGYTLNLVVWAMKNGVFFNLLGSIALMAIAGQFLGFYTNPQIEQMKAEHSTQNAVLTGVLTQLKINSAAILQNQSIATDAAYYQQRTCVNTATTASDREQCLRHHVRPPS